MAEYDFEEERVILRDDSESSIECQIIDVIRKMLIRERLICKDKGQSVDLL